MFGYPEQPPVGEAVDPRSGKVNHLTQEQYESLSETDRVNVDISRMLQYLKQNEPEQYKQFKSIAADLKALDPTDKNQKTLIARWDNFERDRARFLAGENRSFKGRGLVSADGMNISDSDGNKYSFIDSDGQKKLISALQNKDGIFPKLLAQLAFAKGTLRSFQAGDGDVFVIPGQNPRDETNNQDKAPREVRELAGQTTPKLPQTVRDRLLAYLTAPGLWDDKQKQQAGLNPKLKFQVSTDSTGKITYIPILYYSPDNSDGAQGQADYYEESFLELM